MFEYTDADGVILTREEVRAGLGTRPISVGTTDFEESIVDQSQEAENNLNVLVKRWTRGEPRPVFAPPQYGDVSGGMSYQDMHQKLIDMETMFMELPADVRETFDNSPVKFADAFVDPDQRSLFEELGVLEKPAVPAVEVPPVESPPASRA